MCNPSVCCSVSHRSRTRCPLLKLQRGHHFLFDPWRITPRRGRFIYPFAMAGLGLRYFVTPCDVRLGHPLRYSRQIALRRVEIVGLQRDWCANQMLFAFVCTVCVKNAIWVAMLARALANTGAAGKIMSATWWEVVPLGEPNGRVHKSIAGSFAPFKIIVPLYQTMHLFLSNVTIHLASMRMQIPKREAIKRSRMMWPVRTVGSPLILMSHMCVDKTILPLANATFRGCIVLRLLTTVVLSITKIWVAPESATASVVLRQNAAQAMLFLTIWSIARNLSSKLGKKSIASSDMSCRWQR